MEKTEAKKKVLIINTVGMGYEGMSFVILNYISNMSMDGLDLHIVATPDVEEDVRSTLERLGTVHIIPQKQEDLKGYLLGLNNILKSGIDVIHVHGNSGTMVFETILARLHGLRRILVHCHSTSCNYPFINRFLTPVMKFLATDLISCSVSSGKWLYHNSRHLVLNNAIDLEKFAYNDTVRKEVRDQLQIEDEFVIGHVGVFWQAKNQAYLVNVFNELHKHLPYSKLLLVSDGPDFDAVVEQVNQLQLQDAVIFAGSRPDVDRLYQAMDVFVMPSRWEGLPLVLLEAQASGLPIIASDRITKDVQCTDNFWFLNIEESPKVWAEKLMELSGKTIDRTADAAQQLRHHGFDIRLEAERLRELYLK